MFQVATEIGRLLRGTIEEAQRVNGDTGKGRFTATMIVAGQIAGMQPRLFMIYPEGNFIEASWDTPFFQIGETKYGRPILIRGYDPRHELRRCGQTADGQLRFHDQGQPLGRPAAGSAGDRQGRFLPRPTNTGSARRIPILPRFHRAGAMRCARHSIRCRPILLMGTTERPARSSIIKVRSGAI